ncbi:JmjC domain-containing protein [Aphelenchoides besseyi]|nr:JmjC domain-containing protein [Aphelenchoides besseyi]
MEKRYAQWYQNFKPPPEAKTFYPTEAEFADPISYVEQIKAEGEKYGVIKVVPPSSFRPPYSINDDTFKFKTRVQPLYGIDAICRDRIFFIHELKTFWKNAGRDFQWPYINNTYIDFVKLLQLVRETGGVEEVNRQKRWGDFAATLGFDRSDCATLKDRYVKWIEPFEEHWLKRDKPKNNVTVDTLNNRCVPRKDQAIIAELTKKPALRMMAGVSKRVLPLRSAANKLPIKENACGKCSRSLNQDPSIACSECHQEFHKSCLSRMVNNRSSREWKCIQCLATSVREADFFFSDKDETCTLRDFYEMANKFKLTHFEETRLKDISTARVEREYWKNVGDFDCGIKVEYGADLLSSEISSGFPRLHKDIPGVSSEERIKYAKHPWNLNNLPVLERSVLGHVGTEISGMMIPWVYVGMCFSTFCWHVEDHWTYSMNYMHRGETKVWYGFSGVYAERFDALMKEHMPTLFERTPDLLHHMTTMMNPMFPLEKGIPVYTVRQNQGEFVITFPRAYHAGFNSGFNIAEAVNFAPPDWLAVGRTCVESYTEDQRRCVFAHDELVLRIAQTDQRLDVKTCRAVVKELIEILSREQVFRTALMTAGVCKSEACDFEHLEDDQRSCITCQTTLFITALRCQHPERGLACSRHWQNLCSQCKFGDCVIKYRYSLQQVHDFAERLSKRVKETEEWQNVVREMMSDTKKIQIVDAKSLLESFNAQNLLHCNEQTLLESGFAEYRQISQKAQRILRPLVRLRDDTRCQRADDRLSIEDLDSILHSLASCIVSDKELEDKLIKRQEQILQWSVKVENIVNDMDTNSNSAIESLEQLKSEGEAFNVKIPEVDHLQKLIDYTSWRDEAQIIINKYTRARNFAAQLKRENKRESMNEFGIFDPESRIGLTHIREVIAAGARLRNCPIDVGEKLKTLRSMIQLAESHQIHINQFVTNTKAIDFSEVVAFNKTVLDIDWLSSPIVDSFREEVKKAREAHLLYVQWDNSSDYYYHSLDQVVGAFEKSRFLHGCGPHINVQKSRVILNAFTSQANSLFLLPQTYYSTFEILAAREDIPSLIEDGPEVLYRHHSNEGYESWTDLKRFETEDDMSNHVNQLFAEHKNLLPILREHNQKLSVKETCVGAPNCSKVSSSTTQPDRFVDDDYITCFVCCSKSHVGCAPWNETLRRYPPGIYLCIRCCRSKRPDRNSVRVLVNNAPPRARESTLLQMSANKTFHIFDRLKRSTDQRSSVTPLQFALSMEIHDQEIMDELFAKFLTPGTLTAKDLTAWQRVASSGRQMPLQIYGVDEFSTTKKRRYRASRTSNGTAKRQKLHNSDDDENSVVCGAPDCLLPYAASRVRWVMCEGGCSRWFHYICVRLNVKMLRTVQHYHCGNY